MTIVDRPALRRALRAQCPWLLATDVGPRAVDAGSCDGCGEQPRLLPTCGPASGGALCRGCASQAGQDAWCEGHADQGRDALAWAQQLPDDWATIVTLWWVATGELRLDPSLADRQNWPPQVRAALEAG